MVKWFSIGPACARPWVPLPSTENKNVQSTLKPRGASVKASNERSFRMAEPQAAAVNTASPPNEVGVLGYLSLSSLPIPSHPPASAPLLSASASLLWV